MKTTAMFPPSGLPGFRSLRACLWVSGLLWGLSGMAGALDVSFMAVLKGQRFEQDGADFVMLREWDEEDGDGPLALEVFAEEAAAGSLLAGTIQIPGGAAVPLVREEAGDSELRHEYQTEDLLDLNTRCPGGGYTFTLATMNEGPQSVTVSLTGDVYPPVPRITNHPALQAINRAANTVVQWTAFTGGTANDFIMLSVYDNDDQVFQTGGPGAPDSLNGTAMQATIPPNTLQAGRTYEAEVLFVKVVDMKNSYGTAIAGYYKMVNFDISTTAQAGVALGAELEKVLPGEYQSGVACDSAVAFRFTHPMNPSYQAVGWSGSGLNPANFTSQWKDGNRVLWCKYNDDLPAGVRIDWNLDLTGFRDAAGFRLNGSRSGFFSTTMDDPESPPDVDGFWVLKAQGFRQTGTSPVATGMFGCDAGVDLTAFNRVFEPATLTVGTTATTSGRLEPDEWDSEMDVDATFASKADLDRFFANGTFGFDLTTMADGAKSLVLNLGTADNYPPAPTVTNLASLQSINPAAATTITWNALAGWSPLMSVGSGLIELEIENDQGNEVMWVDNEELSSGTQFTIPAGTLWPGRTYRVSLGFIRITDLDDSYGAWGGAAGFQSITEFTIRTAGTPVMPSLAISRGGMGMNVNISGGEPQRNYVVETSQDMQRWLPQEERWIGDGAQFNQFYDDDARYLPQRYYRLRDRMEGEMVQRHVAIQGTVWTNSSHTSPVAGAVVGTTLDGRTAVTDAAGRFFLETDTNSDYSATPYGITVTSGAQSKGFGPWTWGEQPRQQVFEMN